MTDLENGQYYRRRADQLLDARLASVEQGLSILEQRFAEETNAIRSRMGAMEVKLGALIALGSILGPVLVSRLLGG